MKSSAGIDAPTDLVENGSTCDADQDESFNPRKRECPLNNPTDNPGCKRQKHASADNFTTPFDVIGNRAVEEKENNGRCLSPKCLYFSKRNDNDFFADRNVNRKNKPPEAGVITRIYIENFMCHRKLSVDLCRNVNFIYGQNGSGKSAILTAIQICLGSGARRTNRARSLKELVRKDASSASAKVRVTLLNKGSDAFQHDIYGDYITVERTIALRGGFNGYKLFNADNVERSRSKKDLSEMLDKLNIQVDNPVAILDQEEAKKFLTGKAEEKYKFFMKATELERIDNTYKNTMEQIYEMEQQSSKLEQAIELDLELVRVTKKAYLQHQIISRLEDKKARHETQLGWANYKVSLEEQQFKINRFEKFREKAQKKKQELMEAEAASQEVENPSDELLNRLEALTKEANDMSVRKRELEQELKRASEPQKSLMRQVKVLKKEEERAHRSLLDANQRLQARRDEKVANAGSMKPDKARWNERLRTAEKNLYEQKNRHGELKQAVTDAYNSYEDIEPEVLAAHHVICLLKNQLKAIESKIRSMESSSGNSLNIFGPRCARVKQMVDKATKQRKFRGPVLGPIGAYCKIQHGKGGLASMAELAIGNGLLDRFVVFNDADRILFQKIRRDAGCQTDCGIFQQPQHCRYEIPAPPPGIETVATVISVQNDMIFNCLVDNIRIETKALFQNKKESEDSLLIEDNNNRYNIRGGIIKEAYFLPKGDSWKVTKGNIQMISNTRRLRKTIGADMTAAIKDVKNDYLSMNEDLALKDKNYAKLEHEHTEHKKQWNMKKRDLRKNEMEIDRMTKEIEDIKAEEASSSDNDIDTTEEEEDVSAAQAHLEQIRECQRKADNSIKEKAPKIRVIKENVDEVTARNKMVLRDINEAEQSLSQHYQAIEEQKVKLVKKRKKLQQYVEVVTEYSKEIKLAQDETNLYLKLARQIQHCRNRSYEQRKKRETNVQPSDESNSDNIQEPTEEELNLIKIPCELSLLKDQKHYEDKIAHVQERIELEKLRRLENSDDEPTAYDKYTRAWNTYKAKKEQIQEIDSTSKRMNDDLENRRKRWTQYRDFISYSSSMKFNETLNMKSSSGCIEFDHEEKKLHLIVQKDSNDEQSQQKDVKALSGGERSFTTISLLLALGEMLETPFRVMDEFDVFLDPVTRKKVIDTLVEVGQNMRHRQFIFITPQDVSNLESSSNLKILQMKPPERRTLLGGQEQQTLDFSSI